MSQESYKNYSQVIDLDNLNTVYNHINKNFLKLGTYNILGNISYDGLKSLSKSEKNDAYIITGEIPTGCLINNLQPGDTVVCKQQYSQVIPEDSLKEYWKVEKASLAPASRFNPGIVSVSDQEFAGDKSFINNVRIGERVDSYFLNENSLSVSKGTEEKVNKLFKLLNESSEGKSLAEKWNLIQDDQGHFIKNIENIQILYNNINQESLVDDAEKKNFFESINNLDRKVPEISHLESTFLNEPSFLKYLPLFNILISVDSKDNIYSSKDGKSWNLENIPVNISEIPNNAEKGIKIANISNIKVGGLNILVVELLRASYDSQVPYSLKVDLEDENPPENKLFVYNNISNSWENLETSSFLSTAMDPSLMQVGVGSLGIESDPKNIKRNSVIDILLFSKNLQYIETEDNLGYIFGERYYKRFSDSSSASFGYRLRAGKDKLLNGINIGDASNDLIGSWVDTIPSKKEDSATDIPISFWKSKRRYSSVEYQNGLLVMNLPCADFRNVRPRPVPEISEPNTLKIPYSADMGLTWKWSSVKINTNLDSGGRYSGITSGNNIFIINIIPQSDKFSHIFTSKDLVNWEGPYFISGEGIPGFGNDPQKLMPYSIGHIPGYFITSAGTYLYPTYPCVFMLDDPDKDPQEALEAIKNIRPVICFSADGKNWKNFILDSDIYQNDPTWESQAIEAFKCPLPANYTDTEDYYRRPPYLINNNIIFSCSDNDFKGYTTTPRINKILSFPIRLTYPLRSLINSTSILSGKYSTAKGLETKAIGDYSTAEGFNTISNAKFSHAEGSSTIAGVWIEKDAEDKSNILYQIPSDPLFFRSMGTASHAEGINTIASGDYSHVEGDSSHAEGSSSHAEGSHTCAVGPASHAEGAGTITNAYAQHVFGYKNDVSVLDNSVDKNETPVEIVGWNGNIRTLSRSGNEWIKGNITAQAFEIASSRKFKENINPTKFNGLETLEKAEVVDFNYIADTTKAPKVGLIAEDCPDILASPNKMGLDTNNCLGILMKAVQELNEEVKDLKRQITELKR